MYEILEILTKQADEEVIKYIERKNPVYSIGQSSRGLIEPYMTLIEDDESYGKFIGTISVFGTINRNGRLYKEYDPFVSGQPSFILQPPKFLFDLWVDFLNDTKQLSFYRLRKTTELLKEVPTIHINGGVEHAIEVSKNKYEQTQRGRKDGVSSYGRSRPFWS